MKLIFFAIYAGIDNLHSFHISLIFFSKFFSSQNPKLYGTDSQDDISPNITILISSSVWSTVTYCMNPKNLHLLHLSLFKYVQQSHLLTLYLVWLLVMSLESGTIKYQKFSCTASYTAEKEMWVDYNKCTKSS